MNESKTRRNFIKSLCSAGVVPGIYLPYLNFNHEERDNPFPYKLKLSLNVYSFNRLLREGKIDLFDVMDFCAEYNFDAIDPTGYYFKDYPAVPSLDYINKFKKKAFLLGLDISGTGVRNDFSNPDRSVRKADIKIIKNWIEIAAHLGAPVLRIFAGNNPHKGFSRDQVFKWMSDDIKECCDCGGDHGVIIALQNHNGFLKTADDVTRLFEMVDSEWLGLNLDIGSYRVHNPYLEIRKNIHYAVTWQIKENVWINGRESPTDFIHLFRIIKNAGYRGYLPLETLGEGDPFEKVPALLNNVKSALKKI